MPITPYVGMVDSAIRFKSSPNLWMCIGRTTPWEDDNNPPDENDTTNHPEYLNMVTPEEPIALKRLDFAGLCMPDANGNIRYREQRYSYVADADAVALLARWVYLRASLDYYERNSAGDIVIGTLTYRQITLISGLVPTKPYKEENVLTPQQVDHWGRIVMVANFSARARDPRMRDVMEFVRELRS